MSPLKKWTKSLVLANPRFAERFYGMLTILRAKRAARDGASFGQSGEDAWLVRQLADSNIPWAASGFYIDIGANHPVVLSSTYLLYRHGWRGLTVEPIPSLCALHRRMRPRDICLNAGVGARAEERAFWETAPDVFSSFSREAPLEAEANGWCRVLRESRVRVVTPDDILHHVPEGIAVNHLSIDTEGLDVEILANWPWERSRPDLISCEASATRDHRSEANRLLTAAGYQPVKEFAVTAFWKSATLGGDFG
ncbi:MAG: FkbM family methyltransferase [Chthoniobacterales bacterium]|nr:FkbM family methyltransferase [Chthoniobacterales bacterium]